MRLLLLFLGCSFLGGLSGCAQSETVSGGGGSAAFGGFAGDGGPTGGMGGASGGMGGASGGIGGASGGSGGSSGGSGGSTGGTGGGTGGSGGCTPPVTGGQCDTSPQCGCTGAQACNVTSEAGTTQCTSAGSITPYNLCTNLNDCTKGYACVGSACKAYCETNADCATSGGSCFQVQYTATGGTSQPIPGMKVCSKKCELQNPASACGPGLSCYPDMQAIPPKTDCAKAGTATSAGACLNDGTACAPGYACLSNGDCKKWCRVQFSGDCGTGKTCQGWSAPNEIIVDGITYGVCNP